MIDLPAMLSYEAMAYCNGALDSMTPCLISLSDPHSKGFKNRLKNWLFSSPFWSKDTFDDNHGTKIARANGACLSTCKTL